MSFVTHHTISSLFVSLNWLSALISVSGWNNSKAVRTICINLPKRAFQKSMTTVAPCIIMRHPRKTSICHQVRHGAVKTSQPQSSFEWQCTRKEQHACCHLAEFWICIHHMPFLVRSSHITGSLTARVDSSGPIPIVYSSP